MTEEKPKLLIVEDDLGLQKQLKWCFDEHEVLIAATARRRSRSSAGSSRRSSCRTSVCRRIRKA